MARSFPWKAIAGVVVLAMISCGAYYLFFLKKKPPANASTANLTLPDNLNDGVKDPLAGSETIPAADEVPADAPSPSGSTPNSAPPSSSAAAALARANGLSGNDKLAALKDCLVKFQSDPAGHQAAKEYGDLMYASSAAGKTPELSRWEDIRDAYTVVLRGHSLDAKTEADAADKLDRLNAWLLFDRSASCSVPASVTHEIQPGESLWSIAKKYGVSHNQIKRMNGIANEGSLRAGQKLRVFMPKTCEIVVDATHLNLTLYYDDRFIKRFPVGLGKNNSTPEGVFTIVTKDSEPHWYYNGEKIPYGDPRNILGSRWMGFNGDGPGAGIGIHGTRGKEGIGARESMGCIRMINEDVEFLYDLTPAGTTVRVMK